MTDLYLIAHKVRGEPAFDVAAKIDCPECAAQGCNECDGQGFWWIVPTSGHRAYPWWHIRLEDCIGSMRDNSTRRIHISLCGDMPPGLPDHYPTRAEPQRSLIDLLGLAAKPQATSAPIKRRF